MKSKHPILSLLHKTMLMLALMLLTVMGSGSVWGQSPVVITTDVNGNGTIEDSEKKLYLIQTNAFPSFYIAPQANNTITTNNILGEYMLWYFLDAGEEGGTQYYYIVNDSTGKYISHADGSANNDTKRGVPSWKLLRLDRITSWKPTDNKFNIDPKARGFAKEAFNGDDK